MIRLILFAWFALAAILLVATDLSEDHHLKQISSTYFAQNDNLFTKRATLFGITASPVPQQVWQLWRYFLALIKN